MRDPEHAIINSFAQQLNVDAGLECAEPNVRIICPPNSRIKTADDN